MQSRGEVLVSHCSGGASLEIGGMARSGRDRGDRAGAADWHAATVGMDGPGYFDAVAAQ